jgi:hypothetical protein
MKFNLFFSIFFSLLFHGQAFAINWANTEIHIQNGTLEQVGTDGAESKTTTLTLQHAHGWSLGENFFFIDYAKSNSNQRGRNPFNQGADDNSFYGEWYSFLSLNKAVNYTPRLGLINDIGPLLGVNFAPDVDSWWLLPGIRFSLDLPGFHFSNIDITAFINQGSGSSTDNQFVIIDESTSWMADFNWAYPFSIGQTNWSLEGHIEYINGRHQHSNFGDTKLSDWVLAQPQLRLDAGQLLFNKKDTFFIGLEYQYWHNKLGEKGTHDHEAQLLMVFRL